MPRRQPRRPLPALWLVTDERQGERLLPSVARLRRGCGVLFRHRSLAPADRRRLFARLRAVARRRGLVLLWAGTPRDAAQARADGVHGDLRRGTARPLLRTAAAHDPRELERARRGGADLAFLSPLFATRSHPGARPLGRARFGLALRTARLPVIALGGVQGPVRMAGVAGWAAIDALTR